MGHLLETVAQYSVPALATLAGVWLTSRRTDRKVERAIELAEPTGNGFAKTVKDSLARLELDARETRADVRRARSDLSEVRADFSRHLLDHATPEARGRGRDGGASVDDDPQLAG